MPPLVKCVDCSKSVTKKQAGIECSKCRKWRHATCAGIPMDQVAVLANTECVDWVCRKCNKNPKRLSILLPDQNEDEIATPTNEDLEVNKPALLAIIKTEATKLVKKELLDIQQSIQFYSDKFDDHESEITSLKQHIKKLEAVNSNLKNQNEHVNLRCSALEQRINELDQEKLNTIVEIAGIPAAKIEEASKIVATISEKIQTPMEDVLEIKTVKRILQNKSKEQAEVDRSLIILTMKNEEKKKNWIKAGREAKLTVSIFDETKEGKIHIREALIKNIKTLLWETREKLKATHKFVWCKEGRVLVKKSENANTLHIRSVTDIEKILRN